MGITQKTRTSTTESLPHPARGVPTHSLVVPKMAQKAAFLETPTLSDALVGALAAMGVEHAFGVFGGAIAPFCESLSRSSIELFHSRSEGGAAFAALESSLATGKLAVVVATTGPGMTNLLTGMVAARAEGGRVLFVSGTTNAAQRGRWAFQETSPCHGGLSGFFSSGALFHHAQVLEQPEELPSLCARIATGITCPGGFVAHVGLPLDVQTARRQAASHSVTSIPPASVDESAAQRCVRLLTEAPFVIWAGFGARTATPELLELAERCQAPVMCSPRAKGVFPEGHPLYLGVTGLGGHDVAESYMRKHHPARALVLGSRLGEMTSFWSPELVPAQGFIHVDLDSGVFGTAYPAVPTLGVQAEVRAFLRALLHHWPSTSTVRRTRVRARSNPPADREPRPDDRVRPSFLMQCVQRHVVEGSDAVVLTEAGNSFILGSHHLRFSTPGRYRVSTSFGSMGHAAAGVLGAALGCGQAVALVGDGAMLMVNEMSTAAQYGVRAIWVIINDARYGMIAEGMESIGWQPFETDFPQANFAAIAVAMGVPALRVEHEADVGRALDIALAADGPFVLDVVVERSEPTPTNRRNKSLLEQGVNGSLEEQA